MTKKRKPKAYSYIRFSTPDQMKGDSYRRQTEAAVRYALEHGLELDDIFSFKDLGVSAFRGGNLKTGKLGLFLEYVRSGDIEQGSYLLVENLDRVSRENALDAVITLRDITREGVTVVTLNDNRCYTWESLRDNQQDLLLAVLMFMRANEESATKAKRLKAVWSQKRSKGKEKPLTAICPAWLKLKKDRSGFEIIEARAEIVKQIFQLTLEGVGQHRIASELNQNGVEVFGKGKMWHRSYISKILDNEAVTGTFIPHKWDIVEGKRMRTPQEAIDGYYPSIVDDATFERVRALSSGRTARTQRSRISNILAGLAKCPQCTSTMTRVNKGTVKGGKPYLVCTKAKSGSGCKYKQVRLEQVEHAILEDRDLFMVFLPSAEEGLNEKWEDFLRTEDVIADQIANVGEAIELGGYSKALSERLEKLEKEREQITNLRFDVERSIAENLSNRIKDTVSELQAVCSHLPPNIPKINTLLRQLFVHVEVDYIRGELWFHWKHSEEPTSIRYALPEFVD